MNGNVKEKMKVFHKILDNHPLIDTAKSLLKNIEILLIMKEKERLRKSEKLKFIDDLKSLIARWREDIINDKMTDEQYLSMLVLAKCMIKETMEEKN